MIMPFNWQQVNLQSHSASSLIISFEMKWKQFPSFHAISTRTAVLIILVTFSGFNIQRDLSPLEFSLRRILEQSERINELDVTESCP